MHGVILKLATKEKYRIHINYRIHLKNRDLYFKNTFQSWNKNYEAAQKIFGNSSSCALVRAGIHFEHSLL